MTIIPLPAFSDNYIWLMHDGHHALVVDPGDAQPVIDHLEREQLQLAAILITHHHADHVGGLRSLLAHAPVPVFGPANENIDGVDHRLVEGDTVYIAPMNLDFDVLDIPAHTAGHIAFVTPSGAARVLFCGDTLFSAGCGRLFEGSPSQLASSLAKLAALPDDTRVYCTHEYTLSNLRFAQAVEPGNAALTRYRQWCDQQRAQDLPTLPSTMGLEQAINPFLRAHQPSLAVAAQAHNPACGNDPLAVFATLREWKNVF